MRWRLLAALLGVVTVMLIAQDVPLVSHLRRVERDRQLTDMERDAFIIAGQAATALRIAEGGDAENAVDRFDAIDGTLSSYASVGQRSVTVVDAAGEVVATAGDDATEAGASIGDEPDIAAALARQSAAGGGDGTISVAVPVLDGADPIGVVRLSARSSVVDDRVDDRVRGLLWVALISLGAAIVVALLISGTVTRPLRKLQRSTERLAAGEFDARADESEGPPEIRRLARAFNTMTSRITRSIEQQRAFAGDASHQLRTPLTALRLQLERTTELVDGDPTGAHRNLDAAADEIARMQRMIDGLLLLSRSDDPRPHELQRIDVTAVSAERAAVWTPLAEEQGVTISTWATGTVEALALPGAVEQIVDNFIDNALAVAPAGTSVDLVIDGGPAVTIHVLDRGPGLSDDQLAAAFGRFWRSPTSRHDGSGLGLAIVAHLAASSCGSVHLERRPGGGLDASLRLLSAPTPNGSPQPAGPAPEGAENTIPHPDADPPPPP